MRQPATGIVMEHLAEKMQEERISKKRKAAAKRFIRRSAEQLRGTVIARAKERCEVCESHMPFTLETHHIRPVSDGPLLMHVMMSEEELSGNLIALCPNCHATVGKLRTKMRRNYRFNQWIAETYGPEKEAILRHLAGEQPHGD